MTEEKTAVHVNRLLGPIMPEFLERRRLDCVSLRQAVKEGDYPTLGRLGHRMAGNGSAYGLDTISDVGEELEKAAEAKDEFELRRLVAKLAAYLERLEVVCDL